jgi:hypothetical protein
MQSTQVVISSASPDNLYNCALHNTVLGVGSPAIEKPYHLDHLWPPSRAHLGSMQLLKQHLQPSATEKAMQDLTIMLLLCHLGRAACLVKYAA